MREFEDKFRKMINRYNRLDNIDIEFVPGIKVSHLDAHLLALMSENPLKKVSELAKLFGVTKGAISQQIKKLEKRGLITRIRQNDNYREVFIELTANGRIAVETHNNYHNLIFSKFSDKLNNFTPEQKHLIYSLLDTLTEMFEGSENIIKESF